MHSLALDPNSDDLRDLMKSLDPAAELPTKRPCFVVTAASGDASSFEVRTLSRFRDQYLLGNPLGESVVHQYYRYGPYAARLIASVEAMRIAVRFALQPVVFWAWLSLHPSVLLIAILLGWVVIRGTSIRLGRPRMR